MKRRFAIAAGVFSALVISGIGLAATGEPNSLLTEGYDSDNHNLVWGVAEHPESEGTSATLDCRVVDGSYTYAFEESGKVVSLASDAGIVLYQPVDEAAEPVPYGETEECILTVTNVEGPNGQVNHGSVVSNFVHAVKDAGIRGAGCYVRFIARSDYGKGDQQVQVGDVVPTDPVTTGEVTLATHETTCGNKHVDAQEGEVTSASRDHGNGNGNGNGNGHGKPPWAGQGGGRP